MKASLAAISMAFAVACSLAFAIAAPSAASAQSQPVVVELYTSQGCSSCPPADAILAELAKRDDVIALALHVDYWDYLGWKDQFGSPDHAQRQRAYARRAGKGMVYTPQMIVGGRDHLVGAKPMKLAELISAHYRAKPAVTMRLTRDGDVLAVIAERNGSAALPEKMMVHLVRFDPLREVEIRRGENAGRKISYANIVTSWDPVAKWDGKEALKLSIDLRGDTSPVAVLVQTSGHGPILAAAQMK